MTYFVQNIGRYIVNYFTASHAPISNLQLQKLLYFLWIDFYKETKRYLFDEPMAAWPLGPVSLSTYRDFYVYGAQPIDLRYNVTTIDDNDKVIINRILKTYKDKSAYVLVEKSHESDGPWDEAYRDGKGRGSLISFESMKKEASFGVMHHDSK